MKKRLTAILITLAILMITGVVAYAVINFIITRTQTSVFTKKEYFEMESSEIFSETSEVGPGVGLSINPMITSRASVDMYVFIRVEMPVYNGGGLYSLDVNSGWSLVEENEIYGQWVEVYRYDDVLTFGASTTVLSSSLTMVDMSLSDYGEISEIDVSMTGYACKTDVAVEDAWDYIKGEAGL